MFPQEEQKKILIVDDEPVNREVARLVLEDIGLSIDDANDGAVAVKMVEQTSYDLILMDMQMPNLDGLAATELIRKLPNGERVPILAMTANAFVEDKSRCIAAGMNDFITKPVVPEKLYERLLEWLAKSR